MLKWAKQNTALQVARHKGSLNLKQVSERAENYFKLQDFLIKELEYAKSKWRTHLDLLSDIDELNQCKQTMRLCCEGENLFGLTAHEQAFIVQPRDISTLIMDHTAKQAMAEGNLRRTKELLRFLKNQNLEQKHNAQKLNGENNEENKDACIICLCPFEGNDRAVLRCGHTFHYSPCLEQLFARGGRDNQTIKCPMRCAIRTRKQDVLIASDIRKDDGSKTQRPIKGSWGTKVDRLVSDLLGVIEMGEKSIVFSQWDDMLHIMEIALETNLIQHVRPKSMKKFGDSMNYFRTSDCHVLLLHVKHGAEGLTLVEANHVFMIEPLLNYSMDSQAINRVSKQHRSDRIWKDSALLSI
jgi:E3 ubiquitin-protein ligase SHPRH